MPLPLTVTLWGVRGSIPAPGPETARYGGNTSCVAVEAGRRTLIFDAGTGIRALGRALAEGTDPVFLLVTHHHWDHIQGFPFFWPIYQPEREVHLIPYHDDSTVLDSLLGQMDGARFPVRPEHLKSRLRRVAEEPVPYLRGCGFGVSQLEVNHPGGCHGYRIEGAAGDVVHIPDNELEPPGPKTVSFERLVEFCAGAAVLIHDAQYLPADMPLKHGWGHSVVEHVLQLAAAARVGRVVLFHHDPDRSDAQVDVIQAQARAWLAAHAPGVECDAAAEGMQFTV